MTMIVTKSEAYQILGLSQDASMDEIRSSYKKLALMTHPDKNSNKEEATKEFQRILLAYKTLTAPESERRWFEDISPGMMDKLFELFLKRVFSSHSVFSSDDEVDIDDDSCNDDTDNYSQSDSDSQPYFCPKHAHLHNCNNTFSTRQERYTLSYNSVSEEVAEKNARELIALEEQEKRKVEKKRQRKRRRKEKKRSNTGDSKNSSGKENDEQTGNLNVDSGDEYFEFNSSLVREFQQQVDLNTDKSSDQHCSDEYMYNSFEDDWKTVKKEKKTKDKMQNGKKTKRNLLQQQSVKQSKPMNESKINYQNLFSQPNPVTPPISKPQQQQNIFDQHFSSNTDTSSYLKQHNGNNNFGIPPAVASQFTLTTFESAGDSNNNCLSQDSSSFLSKSSGSNYSISLHGSNASSMFGSSGYYSGDNLLYQQRPPVLRTIVSDSDKETAKQWAKDGNKLATGFNQLDTAFSCFTKAINIDPTECRYYGNRAFCLENLGYHREALQDAEISLQLDPTYIKGHFRKGRALLALDRLEEAEASFAVVARMDPSDLEARDQLIQTRLLFLTRMGFNKVDCVTALQQCNSLEKAVSYLKSLTKQGIDALSATSYNYSGPPRIPSNQSLSFSDVSRKNLLPVVSVPKPQATTTVLSPDTHSMVDTKYDTPPTSPAISNTADPHMDPSNPLRSTALWVGNVMPTVTEKKLAELFGVYGKVLSVKLMKQTCCAFVNMTTPEGAGHAVGEFMDHPPLVGGRELMVRFSQSSTNKKTTRS